MPIIRGPGHRLRPRAAPTPIARAQRAARLLRARARAQIAVAIFPSLDGEALEDFSIRLAEKWKIGGKKNDDGVLVTVFLARSQDAHRGRLRPRGQAHRRALGASIRDDLMAPRFRSGRLAKAGCARPRRHRHRDRRARARRGQTAGAPADEQRRRRHSRRAHHLRHLRHRHPHLAPSRRRWRRRLLGPGLLLGGGGGGWSGGSSGWGGGRRRRRMVGRRRRLVRRRRRNGSW